MKKAHRFWRPVLTRTHRLPCSRATLKVAECLGKLEWLNDNTLPFFVIAQLGVSSQREVLAQWVAIETIVGHDTAKVGVSREKDTEHIVYLTLVPQCTLEQTSHTGNGGGFVGVGLDADTGVVADTEKIVDDLETLVAGREVNTSDVGDLSVLGHGVILQEAHNRNDTGGRGVDGDFILPDGELLDVFWKAGHNVLPIGVQAVGLVLVFVGRVENGGTERSLG